MQHNQLEIIDSISTGVIAMDADLQVLAINAAGQAMLELSEARSMRLHASGLVADSASGSPHWYRRRREAVRLPAEA